MRKVYYIEDEKGENLIKVIHATKEECDKSPEALAGGHKLQVKEGCLVSKEIVDDITSAYCGLFAERDTIDEALAYAQDVLSTLEGHDRIAATTAIQVVLNTLIPKLNPGKGKEEQPDNS